MNTTPTTPLDRAIAKSRKSKCFVKRFDTGAYLVITPEGHRYTVRAEIREGLRWMVCNCKAAHMNQICFHVVPAALVDTGLRGN